MRRDDFDLQEIQKITFRAGGKSYLQRMLTQRSTLPEWDAKSARLKRSNLFPKIYSGPNGGIDRHKGPNIPR